MKKKVLCTAMAVTILLTQTASAAPRQMRRNQLIFDNEIEFLGNVTLQFASDGGSFIRPITKRYGESISLESYIPQNMDTHSRDGSQPPPEQSRIR